MARRKRSRDEGPARVEVRVLRVFCDEQGGHGNPLGVILDGPLVPVDDRQALAHHLNYSETVFVDDAEQGRISIFTPEVELPFAGHPVVGTGWLLAREGHPAAALLTPAGKVDLAHADGLTRAVAESSWCPPFELIEHPAPDVVESLSPGAPGWRYEWAWIDEAAGLVRARSFVDEAGVPEDEATGSAAIRLAAHVGREITVHQGVGSEIQVRPLGGDRYELSGRVAED